MATPKAVSDLLRKLPSGSGVYQFLDEGEQIIYIGKAKNLKNRVRSYFQKSADHSPKNERLIKEITDLKWIETDSEVEALTLEANLVKEHQPKFNVLLRDDKHFLYFKITKEKYPRVEAVRRVERDGAKYFGPKTDARALRETIRLLEKLFHSQVCQAHPEQDHEQVTLNRKRIKLPCPFFSMGMCVGPQFDSLTEKNYESFLTQVVAFLAGNTKEFEQALTERMQAAVVERNFELAARLRDRLTAIQVTSEKQLASDPDLASRDILGLSIDGSRGYLAVLEVRGGKLINQQNFMVKAPPLLVSGQIESKLSSVSEEEVQRELLTGFLEQYYLLTTDLPREILLPIELEGKEFLEEWLALRLEQTRIESSSAKSGTHKKVKILTPQKGKKERFLRLAEKNAKAYKTQSKAKFENASARTVEAAADLAKALNIDRKLKRIEAYDISHLGGTATVGSMVVFEHGEPKNTDYRQFKLRELPEGKIDDFASMAEVLKRRIAYLTSQLPEGVKIRKAAKKDAEFLEEARWKDFKTGEICDDLKEWWVVELDKKVIARAKIRFWEKEKIWVIYSLKVIAELQGNKFGLALLKKMLEKTKAAKIYLGCNPKLIEYYSRIGFQAVRVPPELLQKNLQEFCKRNPDRSDLKDDIFMVWSRRTQQVDASFSTKPDLVILDGGKGQLSSVLKVVKFPKTTTVIALAKREEEIWRVREPSPQPSPEGREGKIEFEKILLPKGMKIRKATKKELPKIYEFVAKAGLSTDFVPKDKFFVIIQKKEILGCCRLIEHPGGYFEVASLWVRGDMGRQGLGGELMRYAIKKCPAKKLYLVSALTDFYSRFGFQTIRAAPNILEQKRKERNLESPDNAAKRTVMVWDGSTQKKSSLKLEFEKILLPKDTNALHLITRIRDEAHRSANELREKILSKIEKASELDRLSGVGEGIRRKLLREFNSVEEVKRASKSRLVSLLGLKLGEKIHKQLH